jgi:hypothetical protein
MHAMLYEEFWRKSPLTLQELIDGSGNRAARRRLEAYGGFARQAVLNNLILSTGQADFANEFLEARFGAQLVIVRVNT